MHTHVHHPPHGRRGEESRRAMGRPAPAVKDHPEESRGGPINYSDVDLRDVVSRRVVAHSVSALANARRGAHPPRRSTKAAHPAPEPHGEQQPPIAAHGR